MKCRIFLIAAAALCAPCPALAQLTEEQKQQIDALPLDQLCSATGSLDVRFGATDHGLPLDEHAAAGRQLDARLAPFTSAVMRFSPGTARFKTVRLAAPFDHSGTATEAAQRIGARFAQAGWHSAPKLNFGYFGRRFISYREGPASPEVRLYSTAPVAPEQPMTASQPVVSVATQTYGEELGLFCLSILEDVWGDVEATQAPPVELAMPAFPKPLPVSSYTAADCEDPAKLEAIFTPLDEASAVGRAVSASKNAADWKRALIIATGKTTAAALDAGLEPLLERFYDDTRNRGASWEPLMYFYVTEQALEICEVAVRIPLETNAELAAAQAGLTAIHEYLNAEAARLGVEITAPE